MAIMDRIVRVGLSENAILILMHVVIFSADGLQLNQRHFIEEVQIEYLNLLYRWEMIEYRNLLYEWDDRIPQPALQVRW